MQLYRRPRECYDIKNQWTNGPVNAHLTIGVLITKTRPCNMQQYFSVVKMFIFR